VSAGNRRALLRFADQLCAKLGFAEVTEEVDAAEPRAGVDACGGPGVIGAEDELLVAAMRRALAAVAAAVASASGIRTAQTPVSAALDGAEVVMRGELVSGNSENLPALIPGFVFLVTLPIVEVDEALHLSRRTSELVEEALGS
jgi:hypothetical protein